MERAMSDLVTAPLWFLLKIVASIAFLDRPPYPLIFSRWHLLALAVIGCWQHLNKRTTLAVRLSENKG